VDNTPNEYKCNTTLSVIRKYSTLPRIKPRDVECSVRKSLKVTKNKSRDARCSWSEEIDPINLANNNITNDSGCCCDKINNTAQTSDNNNIRMNEIYFHTSTTLPKARSRMSEPLHFRHSLRHTNECLTKHSDNNNNNIRSNVLAESTSGASK
jgi:hypothetical protein